MTKFKELSKLTKDEVKQKIDEVKMELVKARITATKGGKVKIKEIKKTLSNLLMLKTQKNSQGKQNKPFKNL